MINLIWVMLICAALAGDTELEFTQPGYVYQARGFQERWVPVEPFIVSPKSAWPRSRLLALVDQVLAEHGAEEFAGRTIGGRWVVLPTEACSYVRQDGVGLQEMTSWGVEFDPAREICVAFEEPDVRYLIRQGGGSVLMFSGIDLADRSPRPTRQEHWLYGPFQVAAAVWTAGCTPSRVVPLTDETCVELGDALNEARQRLDLEAVRG